MVVPRGRGPRAARSEIKVNLQRARRGFVRKSKLVRLHMVATADARPPRDSDRLLLQCLPAPPLCPENTAGGPSRLTLAVPEGAVGTDLDILDVTTATSSKTGSPPCPGQPAENSCHGPCGSACGAFTDACIRMIEDPVNPGMLVCQDKKGGISQRCCINNSATPCFPSAAEGGVVRIGRAVPWNEPGYPKSSDIVLVSTFCLPCLGICEFNLNLPGPGALILPVRATYTRVP
jgi:hypothetical protein